MALIKPEVILTFIVISIGNTFKLKIHPFDQTYDGLTATGIQKLLVPTKGKKNISLMDWADDLTKGGNTPPYPLFFLKFSACTKISS